MAAISICWWTLCQGSRWFDLGGLHTELEDLLGVRVDLLTPGDLPPKLRERVLSEAQAV